MRQFLRSTMCKDLHHVGSHLSQLKQGLHQIASWLDSMIFLRLDV